MRPERGVGQFLKRGHYGTVDCPHCPNRNVLKVCKAQVTCGRLACLEKQIAKRAMQRRERSKRTMAAGSSSGASAAA